jgi:hypothetical protein
VSQPGETTTMRGTDSFMMTFVYFAIGCGMVGIIITFFVIWACRSFGIDIQKNLWVLVIPATLSILLNIGFLELYRKYKRK